MLASKTAAPRSRHYDRSEGALKNTPTDGRLRAQARLALLVVKDRRTSRRLCSTPQSRQRHRLGEGGCAYGASRDVNRRGPRHSRALRFPRRRRKRANHPWVASPRATDPPPLTVPAAVAMTLSAQSSQSRRPVNVVLGWSPGPNGRPHSGHDSLSTAPLYRRVPSGSREEWL